MVAAFAARATQRWQCWQSLPAGGVPGPTPVPATYHCCRAPSDIRSSRREIPAPLHSRDLALSLPSPLCITLAQDQLQALILRLSDKNALVNEETE